MTPGRVQYCPTSKYARVVHIIQHGDVKTGNTYKFGFEQGINAIPTATLLHIGFWGCLVEWHSAGHHSIGPTSLISIQHCPSIAYKYFRFWCRHGLLRGRIYKSTYNRGRETIPRYINRFYTTGGRTIHWPTTKYTRVVHNLTWRRRNRSYFQVRLEAT